MVMSPQEITARETFAHFKLTPEIGGGGAVFYSRYWANGPYVWATDESTAADWSAWIVCAYPAGWDGEPLTDYRNGYGHTLAQAVTKAVEDCEAMLPSTDKLADNFRLWGKGQKLELQSADEMIWRDDLTTPQRAYLREFMDRWEEAQAQEDYLQNLKNRGET